uniref:Basal body-orientation factor 1 n=1 Tax=Macrostomum lignano TaxID=282301 RepID=A0A1I8IPR3_9PLAT
MPKKGKKGKGGGKGKGKKGEKGSKKADKKAMKEESSLKLAERSVLVWETRAQAAEKQRTEFRESAVALADQNSQLKDLMHKTEKDTIEVITYLKKQDQEKEDQIYKLNESIKEMKRLHRDEKAAIIADLGQQIQKLEATIQQKSQDVQLLQNELKMVKEFRKNRQQMQKELDEIKDSLFYAGREHKETLAKMEQKFFEEKMRLQQEANQKIAELAERAHAEAITNLDETTRSVYKENVRLTEALNYHMREGDILKKKNTRLKEAKATLADELETAKRLSEEKNSQRLRRQQREAEEKISLLEQSLNHLVREFDTDRAETEARHRAELANSVSEIDKLKRLMELRNKETSRLRKLAKNILDQRSDMERFFLEALDNVREEIAANQENYKREAQQMYNRRMLEAHAGKADYPPVRTFQKSDHSTNNVYTDLSAAEKFAEELTLEPLDEDDPDKTIVDTRAFLTQQEDESSSTVAAAAASA